MSKTMHFWPLAVLMVVLFTTTLRGQSIYIKTVNKIHCGTSGKNEGSRIGPPEQFSKRKSNPSGRTENANFQVEYIGFPTDVQATVQYAIDIWGSLLNSPIPIHVTIEWDSLPSGTLGAALWGGLVTNFEGGNPQTWYPVALAEKISGKEHNAVNEADIVSTLNKNVSWYLGTDGNTPVGQIDLVSVVLHEIGHGLGITHSFSEESNLGDWGPMGSSNPIIFDVFIENNTGQKLTEAYTQNTSQLYQQFISQELYFGSALATGLNGGSKARIYSPTTFNVQSSISHLDEDSYPAGHINSLMTPHIGYAEAIHDPGPATMGILYEMGWLSTYIAHEPVTGSEDIALPFQIKANIISDGAIPADQIKLRYSFDGFQSHDTTVVMANTTGNEYLGEIKIAEGPKIVSYYLSVTDSFGRQTLKPTGAPGEHYLFQAGIDNDPPEIDHSPKTFFLVTDDSISIDAGISDLIGLRDKYVLYRTNGTADTLRFTEQPDNPGFFHAAFNSPGAFLADGDIFEYQIVAIDKSQAANASTYPADGFQKMQAVGIRSAINSYVTNFDEGTSDFLFAGFNVSQPTGFNNSSLHSAHPYENGSGPDNESSFTAMLLTPIRLDASNPSMQYDEIVLVEPGEEGANFGEFGFWDYVIVEGSGDYGKTWLPITNGYDSRSETLWLQHYNSTISGDDSQEEGTPVLFKRKWLDLLENGNFKAGEEVLIRFRLFADELAHGWGWTIDNLFIQDKVTALNGLENNLLVMAYPNPVKNGRLYIRPDEKMRGKIFLTIFDVSGNRVMEGISVFSPGRVIEKDVGGLSNGVYFIHLRGQDATSVFKFFISR